MKGSKFRAWNVREKRMYYATPYRGYIKSNDSWWEIYNGDDVVVASSAHDDKLMQYTELKDINEAEVYEGDIVKHNGNMKSLIKFIEEEAGFKLINKTLGMMHISKEYFERYEEIVGNIYENPELLK